MTSEIGWRFGEFIPNYVKDRCYIVNVDDRDTNTIAFLLGGIAESIEMIFEQQQKPLIELAGDATLFESMNHETYGAAGPYLIPHAPMEDAYAKIMEDNKYKESWRTIANLVLTLAHQISLEYLSKQAERISAMHPCKEFFTRLSKENKFLPDTDTSVKAILAWLEDHVNGHHETAFAQERKWRSNIDKDLEELKDLCFCIAESSFYQITDTNIGAYFSEGRKPITYCILRSEELLLVNLGSIPIN